ncbi:MAG TPA: hypothetical protein DCM87_04940 [Planctomycetes bacterium]|nr:hypothetical protein [Planctomycetota bacterium]
MSACLQVLFLAWVPLSAAPEAPKEAPKVLLVLATGSDLLCEIVREEGGDIFVVHKGAPLRIDARLVVKRVSVESIAAEIENRDKKIEDAAGCLRLALLCLEVHRPKDAARFIKKADAYLKDPAAAGKAAAAKSDAKEKSPPKDAAGAGDTPPADERAPAKDVAAPWPPPDGSLFLLEVKKKVEDAVSDDPMRKSRVQGLFADSPFGLGGDSSADYVVRIGLEAVKIKTNDFYGSVPISNDWEGKINCVIRHVKTNKIVLQMKPTVARETLPLIAKGDEVLGKAFEQFMRSFRSEPALRLKKEEAPPNPSARPL